MQQLIAANMEWPSILGLEKVFSRNSLAGPIRDLIRFYQPVWDCMCLHASLSLSDRVMYKHVRCPWRVQPEHHPSSSLQAAITAVLSSCYGSGSEGCIHGQRRKLASPNNRPPIYASLFLSPSQAPDPLVNLSRGRRSMAQSCRVTLRDDETENEKEKSYTTQMGGEMRKWKDETKFDYYQEVQDGCGGGVAISHFRKWLLFSPVSLKWRWDHVIFFYVWKNSATHSVGLFGCVLLRWGFGRGGVSVVTGSFINCFLFVFIDSVHVLGPQQKLSPLPCVQLTHLGRK